MKTIEKEIHVHDYDFLFKKLIQTTQTILNDECHRLSCDLDRQEVIKQLLRQFDKDIIESSMFISDCTRFDEDFSDRDLLFEVRDDIVEFYRNRDRELNKNEK